VWATPTKTLIYRKFFDSQTASRLAAEHNGESPKMRQLNQSQAVVFY